MKLRVHHATQEALSDADWTLLEGRCHPASELSHTDLALFSHSNDVANRNLFVFNHLKNAGTDHVLVKAKDSVPHGNRQELDVWAAQAGYKHYSDTGGVPTSLQLAIGMAVMLTNNVDREDRLMNGQRGVIVRWDTGANGNVSTVWIAFEDLRCGHSRKVEENGPVPISPIRVMYDAKAGLKVQRFGFPIVGAAAISIHKSQGLTLTSASVDISKCFAAGQAYVAISRVKSLASLTLIGGTVARKAFNCNLDALQEMERMRAEEPYSLTDSDVFDLVPHHPREMTDVVNDPLLLGQFNPNP